MTGSRASDAFVRCLEAEGVQHVFGIPGEETLDLNHSLAHSQIETATRLGAAFVTVVWEDGGDGSIASKQRQRFDGEDFGTDFGNPDFVGLAESLGTSSDRRQ